MIRESMVMVSSAHLYQLIGLLLLLMKLEMSQ